MEIIKHPNDILRVKCSPILKGDNETLATLREMATFIKDQENNAVGLALPQVGINKNGFVMNVGDNKIITVINPRFLKRGKLYIPDFTESCLSIDNQEGFVQRYDSVFMQYTGPNWKTQTIQLNKYRAVVAQHEYDHLQGILFIDKVG
ncbi:Peptide deformylase 1 [compost metagenome]